MPSLVRYTGSNFKKDKILAAVLFLKTSPRVREYKDPCNKVLNITPSKNEFGWLAAKSTGPFIFNNSFLFTTIFVE